MGMRMNFFYEDGYGIVIRELSSPRPVVIPNQETQKFLWKTPKGDLKRTKRVKKGLGVRVESGSLFWERRSI